MPKLVLLLAISLCTGGVLLGAIETSKDQPVEITSTGQTTYENGLATARDNVAIHIGETDIYSDFAQYNPRTHDIFVQGNVRIYRDTSLYLANQATYNIETKKITAEQMQSDYEPYFVSGTSVTSISQNAYRIEDGIFTTHDSPNPSFYLRARTVRVYEKDYVVFQNVTFYLADVPIFWWPYVYQSLNDAFSFSVSPAFLSSWGPSLLTSVTFPITEKIKGKVRLDYRGRRGPAIGFDGNIDYGKDDSSSAQIKTYYIQDQNPLINRTSLPRGSVPTGRYRLTVEDQTNFTDDIYGIVDITKLSDRFVMQDFYQSEFRIDPVPDNVLAVAKTSPFYTLTAITRFQANEFFEQTERLPEVVLDIKRHALFEGPIYYEGETGFARLTRAYADGSEFINYSSTRLDTFHQLVYPNTYFGWLSVVPRVGFRETYYTDTRKVGNTLFDQNDNPLVPSFILPDPSEKHPLIPGGDDSRTVVNAGFEASFKISRAWEDAESRAFGLDGLRHIIQPFTNLSWVSESGASPESILQFDRYEPSTQLRPIDFPQFTSIDSIDHWTVWRLGLHNTLQTRRDDVTVSWLDLETYADINIDNPYDRTPYSNLFNKLRFTPLPWASLVVNSQLPTFDKGFTEVNTNIILQPYSNFEVSLGHRYLHENPFFNNSSLFVVGGYCRLDDNWGVAVQEQYETTTHILEQQRYSVYRDLTSWVASLGAVVRDNGGVKEYGVLLTFTLKAFPKLGLDLNFDPGGSGTTETP
ncbi:MAG: LPS-assembly protein [Verrucomicrobiota bacterium]|jgi:lipopolysaccharide export system protein LptA